MKWLSTKASHLLALLVCFIVTGCGSANPKAFSAPNQIVFPDEWSDIYAGMTPGQLYDVMGMPRKVEYAESLNGQEALTATYDKPFKQFVFINPEKGSLQTGELVLSNRLSRCSYFQDENGAFEATFPLSKQRTKELFINSAAPLGFLMRQLPDEYSTMSRTIDRYIPDLELEALLNVRFAESASGTTVSVNTESTEIVWKSRDKSYAESLLMHMHCAHTLFEKNYGVDGRANAPETGNQVRLVNYRMVSSRVAAIGEAVEFKIADDAVADGHSFNRGGSAWGVVTGIERFTPAGDVLTIRLERMEDDSGQWFAIKNANGSANVVWQSHDVIEVPAGITVVYARTHSIYSIGETVDVLVGDPLGAN